MSDRFITNGWIGVTDTIIPEVDQVVYDRSCLSPSCDWMTDFSLEPSGGLETLTCPWCGGETVRFMSSAPHMFRDTFGSPMIDSTMDKDTQVFQSRSEHKAAMEARGLKLMDSHVPLPGTDKSPITKPWTSGMSRVENETARVYRLMGDARFVAARAQALETHRERKDNLAHSSH